jgi:hypothetical protein
MGGRHPMAFLPFRVVRPSRHRLATHAPARARTGPRWAPVPWRCGRSTVRAQGASFRPASVVCCAQGVSIELTSERLTHDRVSLYMYTAEAFGATNVASATRRHRPSPPPAFL